MILYFLGTSDCSRDTGAVESFSGRYFKSGYKGSRSFVAAAERRLLIYQDLFSIRTT